MRRKPSWAALEDWSRYRHLDLARCALERSFDKSLSPRLLGLDIDNVQKGTARLQLLSHRAGCLLVSSSENVW